MKNEILNRVVDSCCISIQLVSQRKLLISVPRLGASATIMLRKGPLRLRRWSTEEASAGRDVLKEPVRTLSHVHRDSEPTRKRPEPVTLNLKQVPTVQYRGPSLLEEFGNKFIQHNFHPTQGFSTICC